MSSSLAKPCSSFPWCLVIRSQMAQAAVVSLQSWMYLLNLRIFETYRTSESKPFLLYIASNCAVQLQAYKAASPTKYSMNCWVNIVETLLLHRHVPCQILAGQKQCWQGFYTHKMMECWQGILADNRKKKTAANKIPPKAVQQAGPCSLQQLDHLLES